MMPVSAWLEAVWPGAGCRVTPIKLSCDPPGDDDETGAIIGCWGHRAGSVTVSGDRWLGGDRLHLDSGGDILPDTEHRPAISRLSHVRRCGDQSRALVLPNIGDSEAADRL